MSEHKPTATHANHGCRSPECIRMSSYARMNRERRKRGESPVPLDPELHGNTDMYRSGCRCRPCVRAWRDSEYASHGAEPPPPLDYRVEWARRKAYHGGRVPQKGNRDYRADYQKRKLREAARSV